MDSILSFSVSNFYFWYSLFKKQQTNKQTNKHTQKKPTNLSTTASTTTVAQQQVKTKATTIRASFLKGNKNNFTIKWRRRRRERRRRRNPVDSVLLPVLLIFFIFFLFFFYWFSGATRVVVDRAQSTNELTNYPVICIFLISYLFLFKKIKVFKKQQQTIATLKTITTSTRRRQVKTKTKMFPEKAV